MPSEKIHETYTRYMRNFFLLYMVTLPVVYFSLEAFPVTNKPFWFATLCIAIFLSALTVIYAKFNRKITSPPIDPKALKRNNTKEIE